MQSCALYTECTARPYPRPFPCLDTKSCPRHLLLARQKSHRGRKMFVLGIHTLRARSNVRPLAGSSFISYISGQSFPVTLVQCDSYRLQVWDEYLWKYSYQAPTSSRSCRVLKWKAEWLAKIRLPSGSQAIPFNTSGPSRPAAFASAAAPRIGSQAVARLGPKVQFVWHTKVCKSFKTGSIAGMWLCLSRMPWSTSQPVTEPDVLSIRAKQSVP